MCSVTESATPETSVHGPKIVETCIEVYNTITTQLLPTPSKSHYTFNLRDLSKVFQGMLMADASKIDVRVTINMQYFKTYYLLSSFDVITVSEYLSAVVTVLRCLCLFDLEELLLCCSGLFGQSLYVLIKISSVIGH